MADDQQNKKYTVTSMFASGSFNLESVQKHIDRYAEAGYIISHYSVALDASGGQLHSFIWEA